MVLLGCFHTVLVVRPADLLVGGCLVFVAVVLGLARVFTPRK